MSLYEKIRNTCGEIPEAFDMRLGQADELHAAASDRLDLAYIAFRFGYMQGRRFEQASRTNKAVGGSEEERLRERICEMAGRIRSERRLRQIYTVAHRAFIRDRLEASDERMD